MTILKPVYQENITKVTSLYKAYKMRNKVHKTFQLSFNN